MLITKSEKQETRSIAHFCTYVINNRCCQLCFYLAACCFFFTFTSENRQK